MAKTSNKVAVSIRISGELEQRIMDACKTGSKTEKYVCVLEYGVEAIERDQAATYETHEPKGIRQAEADSMTERYITSLEKQLDAANARAEASEERARQLTDQVRGLTDQAHELTMKLIEQQPKALPARATLGQRVRFLLHGTTD